MLITLDIYQLLMEFRGNGWSNEIAADVAKENVKDKIV